MNSMNFFFLILTSALPCHSPAYLIFPVPLFTFVFLSDNNKRIIQYKKRGELNNNILYDAITMSLDEWISFYGGGKHKGFIYTGKYFKECVGFKFRSLSSFLRIIGEYDRYQLIKSRLLRNYDIYSAIFNEIIDTTLGNIYIIRCKLNNLIYIGQTILTINERFKQHIHSYKIDKNKDEISRKLFKAFDDYGIDNFYIELLEDNIKNENLADREKYWINKYNSIYSKNGLNMKQGSPSPVGFGKEIIYQGRNYNSSKQALRELKKYNPHIPDWIIEKRLRKDEPIPEKPRKHSKYQAAGSKLWRKWKGLKKNGNICEEWNTDDETGYKKFIEDIGVPPSPKHKLGRIDITKPHSKENTRWMTYQEEREIFSGNTIIAFGKTYNSYISLAKEFNISPSTLKYRIDKGISLEDAVNEYKKTSPQRHIYDNICFKSKTQMLHYISEKYNLTFGQAKDRYDRNLPYDHEVSTGNKCNILGNKFNSEKEAVIYYGVSYSSYYKKKAKGLTPEDAIISLLCDKKKCEIIKNEQLLLPL